MPPENCRKYERVIDSPTAYILASDPYLDFMEPEMRHVFCDVVLPAIKKVFSPNDPTWRQDLIKELLVDMEYGYSPALSRWYAILCTNNQNRQRTQQPRP